ALSVDQYIHDIALFNFRRFLIFFRCRRQLESNSRVNIYRCHEKEKDQQQKGNIGHSRTAHLRIFSFPFVTKHNSASSVGYILKVPRSPESTIPRAISAIIISIVATPACAASEKMP